MASSTLLAQASFTIDAASRTPITLPGFCVRAVLCNQDTVNDCTIYDRSSGGTGIVLPAGGQLPLQWSDPVGADQQIVGWATADAGTGPITVRAT